MDAELKAKWIAALRSGSYRQGTGQLRSRDDRFCCLGVLCQVAPNVMWSHAGGRYEACLDDGSSATELPFSLQQSAGLSDDHERKLISMNDDDRKSFAEIADHIEKNL